MQKPLATVGRFGCQFVARQAIEQAAHGAQRIDHAAFGDGGMDVHAAHGDGRQIGGEGLDVDRVGPRAVQCVADLGGQGLQVHMVDTVADLLVASEQDSHGTVKNLWSVRSGTRRVP